MAFATIVTFLSQNLIFQEFSLTFCIIVIVAYMGKDRIKELGRSYLYSKVKSHIYDYKTTIRSTLGKEVGVCRESFTFISESKLPPDIVQLRNKDYISELENGVVGEDIIHSKEVLTLQSRNCKEIYSDFNVDGLVNIVRFNVRHFLEKMDNPVKEIFMPDDVSGIVKVQAKTDLQDSSDHSVPDERRQGVLCKFPPDACPQRYQAASNALPEFFRMARSLLCGHF